MMNLHDSLIIKSVYSTRPIHWGITPAYLLARFQTETFAYVEHRIGKLV